VQQKATEFRPTERQLRVLKALVDPDVAPSVTAICKAADVDRTTYWKWRQNPGFCQWLERSYKGMIAQMLPHLDKVGFAQAAKGNFKFFEFMQRKYGGIPGQIEKGIKEAGRTFGGSMWEALQRIKEAEKD
jgi:hypothetical protein